MNMGSAEDLDYPKKILEYRDGFIVSKAMFTACELGVFELLLESAVPLSSAAIARHLNVSADGVGRLLDTCVGLKLLEIEIDNTEVLYRNKEMSSIYLTKSSPKSLLSMMMHFSQNTYRFYGYTTDAVREGTSQYIKACGMTSEATFDGIYRSEDEMLNFMRYVDSFWPICGRDVIEAFDLSVFPKVCDLGGCTGTLARQCILSNPNSTVIVFDLPKVVEAAKKFFISPEEEQISFIEGDFFKDLIPEADLYILARIIHDWNDDMCLKLFTKIYNTCKPVADLKQPVEKYSEEGMSPTSSSSPMSPQTGGGVLLIELLLNEDKKGCLAAQLCSLTMLLVTEGKERTPSEYTRLLTGAGFRDIEFRTTGKIYDAILGRK